MLTQGKIYFFDNHHSSVQLSPTALLHSLTHHNLCNEFDFEGYIFSRKILSDSETTMELSPIVVEVEHAIQNILKSNQGRSKKTVREILDLDELLNEFFYARAIPTCTDASCSNHEGELHLNTGQWLTEAIREKAQNSDIIYLSYQVAGSFEKLVWEFREAISQGLKRFLIDGEFYMHSDTDPGGSQAVKGSLSFTDLETKLFGTARTIDVIERTVSITGQDSAESRVQELLKVEKNSSRQKYALGILRKDRDSYVAVTQFFLGGSHICPACLVVYDTSGKAPYNAPQYLLGRYTFEEVEALSFDQLKNLCIGHSVHDSTSRKLITICHSVLSLKIDKLFNDLCQYEQVVCYLLACNIKEVSKQFFVFAPLACPTESDLLISEFHTNIRSLLALENSFILGSACFHFFPFFKDSHFIDEHAEVINAAQRGTIIPQALSSYSVEELETAEIAPGLIHVHGPTSSGKTSILKGIAALPLKDKRTTKKSKHEWVYLSYQDNLFFIESSLKNHAALLLQQQDVSVLRLLELEESIAELYASTKTAQGSNLYFQDFLSPQKSNHRCKFCDGIGFIIKNLCFGYEKHSPCKACGATGCDTIYNSVSFLQHAFKDFLCLDLKTFCDEFLIDEKVEHAKKLINELRAFDLHLDNIKLKTKLFELTESERLSFALFLILLNVKEGQSYVFEHIFDVFLNERSNLSAYLNDYFKQKSALLLSSIYR